ncbi:MAG: RNA polymerase sigma factor [Candidatus Limnocylindria bacterium]
MTNTDCEAEFGLLYEPLRRRLLMIVRDAEIAADLTQQAFVRAYEARASFDGRNARAWLFQIRIRGALSHFRRERLWRRVQVTLARDDSFVPPTDVDLWRAIGRLKPIERVVLLLSVLDGYTYQEIGQMLDVHPGERREPRLSRKGAPEARAWRNT